MDLIPFYRLKHKNTKILFFNNEKRGSNKFVLRILYIRLKQIYFELLLVCTDNIMNYHEIMMTFGKAAK